MPNSSVLVPLEQLGFYRIGSGKKKVTKKPVCIVFQSVTLAFDHRGTWLCRGYQPLPGFRVWQSSSGMFKIIRQSARMERAIKRWLK